MQASCYPWVEIKVKEENRMEAEIRIKVRKGSGLPFHYDPRGTKVSH